MFNFHVNYFSFRSLYLIHLVLQELETGKMKLPQLHGIGHVTMVDLASKAIVWNIEMSKMEFGDQATILSKIQHTKLTIWKLDTNMNSGYALRMPLDSLSTLQTLPNIMSRPSLACHHHLELLKFLKLDAIMWISNGSLQRPMEVNYFLF